MGHDRRGHAGGAVTAPVVVDDRVTVGRTRPRVDVPVARRPTPIDDRALPLHPARPNHCYATRAGRALPHERDAGVVDPCLDTDHVRGPPVGRVATLGWSRRAGLEVVRAVAVGRTRARLRRARRCCTRSSRSRRAGWVARPSEPRTLRRSTQEPSRSGACPKPHPRRRRARQHKRSTPGSPGDRRGCSAAPGGSATGGAASGGATRPSGVRRPSSATRTARAGPPAASAPVRRGQGDEGELQADRSQARQVADGVRVQSTWTALQAPRRFQMGQV